MYFYGHAPNWSMVLLGRLVESTLWEMDTNRQDICLICLQLSQQTICTLKNKPMNVHVHQPMRHGCNYNPQQSYKTCFSWFPIRVTDCYLGGQSMFYFWECIANNLYRNEAVLPVLYPIYQLYLIYSIFMSFRTLLSVYWKSRSLFAKQPVDDY